MVQFLFLKITYKCFHEYYMYHGKFVSYKVDKYTNIYTCTHIKIVQNLIIHDCPPYDYIPLHS